MTIPLAVPRPPQAAALQAATRLPVRVTAPDALPGDPEADALVDAAFTDPDAPSIYAEIFVTLDRAEVQLAEMRKLLNLPPASVLVAAGDPAGSWARWTKESGQ